MKILILSDYSYYGGVAMASAALQTCLSCDEVDVVRFQISEKPQGFFQRAISIITASFYLCSNRFDRVLLMHFEAIFVGLLCKCFRVKGSYINVIHTDLFGYYYSVSFIKKLILRIVFSLLRKDPLVFVSKEAELKARTYFGFTNTRTIYNVVIPPLTLSPKLKNKQFRFGSVCRLHSGKNVDLLIRIFNSFWLEHKYTQLLIFGDGPELTKLVEYVSGFPCSGAVSFKGYVSNSDEIYSQIDCLVCFSSMEGFPLVILEALERNIPVLYSDCSCGPREILKPDTDPCQKTETYEVGIGGILVRIETINGTYFDCLRDSEKGVLEVFEILYKEFETLKLSSFVDLKRFGSHAIKRQWIDFLFE